MEGESILWLRQIETLKEGAKLQKKLDIDIIKNYMKSFIDNSSGAIIIKGRFIDWKDKCKNMPILEVLQNALDELIKKIITEDGK